MIQHANINLKKTGVDINIKGYFQANNITRNKENQFITIKGHSSI